MQIQLTDIGKKFGKSWLFRHLNYSFSAGKRYAITGYNGSGKTTLLKLIAAAIPANEGYIAYTHRGEEVVPEHVYRHIAWTGPYTGLPGEMTLAEAYRFYHKFKPISVALPEFLQRIQLKEAAHRPIKDFSSGMQQKLQLALALFSKGSLVLLDEPTANFDKHNTAWFETEIQQLALQKTVLISSNQAHEIALCHEVLALEQWKPA